jgi:hypothetical protein
MWDAAGMFTLYSYPASADFDDREEEGRYDSLEDALRARDDLARVRPVEDLPRTYDIVNWADGRWYVVSRTLEWVPRTAQPAPGAAPGTA